MNRVLIVEDEPQILRTLTITVRASGYEVTTARSAAEALATADRQPPDLVILDLGLPDRDGIDVIRTLRTWSDVPIVVVSGRTGSGDKVAALDAGADDYMTKPFGTDELLARLRAVRRRTAAGERTSQMRLGDLVIDFATRTVTPAFDTTLDIGLDASLDTGLDTGLDTSLDTGLDIGLDSGLDTSLDTGLDITDRQLTPTEWALLDVLVHSPGRLMTHAELARRVWGTDQQKAGVSIRTYLARLRRRLEPDPARPRYLITEPGMGYRFQP